MTLLSADSSKDFMAKLLVSEAFDAFCLQEAMIKTAVSYTINGRIQPDFFPDEERELIKEEFVSFSEMRPRLFELIKGKTPPISFRMTLSLKRDAMLSLLQKESPEGHQEALRAFVINIRYENSAINIITGTSYDSFVMSRSEEKIWDDAFAKFLTSKDISFTIQ